MPRPATVSPDRILDVAAFEFAERGYAGARVDSIARRAGVNKAMLYYHFGSKQALYRALLRRIFTRAAERLRAIAAQPATPERKLHDVISGMAGFVQDHAFFPAIMLREVAEGGSHLDRDTLAALASVPRVVGSIVQQGIQDGSLRPVHPMAVYFTIFAPIVMFMAGAPILKELAAAELRTVDALTPDLFVQHVQDSVHRALSVDASPGTAGAAGHRGRRFRSGHHARTR
jgi:AcrR family transcriptional regulator